MKKKHRTTRGVAFLETERRKREAFGAARKVAEYLRAAGRAYLALADAIETPNDTARIAAAADEMRRRTMMATGAMVAWTSKYAPKGEGGEK